MRIWDIHVKYLCRKHFLAEHRELHGFWNILTKHKGRGGYSRHPETSRWAGKLKALYNRHEQLVKEFKRRGYAHCSPLDKKYAAGSDWQEVFLNTIAEQHRILKEMLADVLDNGKKAIVFTQFAEMADILERELAEWQPLKISGKVREEYRNIVARFNEVEDCKILIMTSAGQFGLNIQRASVIFHYDQEWSLAKMQQREGRAHRYGQKDTVLVYNLLAKGTVDYYVKKVLHAKAELSNQILGDTPISMETIQEMLKYE